MKKNLAKLIDLKSIITLAMTGAIIALLFWPREVPQELLMLFSTSYGAMMTYYFTRKVENKTEENTTNQNNSI